MLASQRSHTFIGHRDQNGSNHRSGPSSRSVRIEGYTDTDPVRSKSAHKSNYNLVYERAYAVRDYLIKRAITKDRISLASCGPDKPLGSKSQSHRVEIVVIAD